MAGRFLALPIFAILALWGCAGVAPAPTPQRERVTLKTSSSTRYYPVRGTTTLAIFDDIDRNGLFDSRAHRAVGLTSADWNMDWQEPRDSPGLLRLLLGVDHAQPRGDTAATQAAERPFAGYHSELGTIRRECRRA